MTIEAALGIGRATKVGYSLTAMVAALGIGIAPGPPIVPCVSVRASLPSPKVAAALGDDGSTDIGSARPTTSLDRSRTGVAVDDRCRAGREVQGPIALKINRAAVRQGGVVLHVDGITANDVDGAGVIDRARV